MALDLMVKPIVRKPNLGFFSPAGRLLENISNKSVKPYIDYLGSGEIMYAEACKKLELMSEILRSQGFMVSLESESEFEKNLDWFNSIDLTMNSLSIFVEDEKFDSQFCVSIKGKPIKNEHLSFEQISQM